MVDVPQGEFLQRFPLKDKFNRMTPKFPSEKRPEKSNPPGQVRQKNSNQQSWLNYDFYSYKRFSNKG